jgi:hypothetical protein
MVLPLRAPPLPPEPTVTTTTTTTVAAITTPPATTFARVSILMDVGTDECVSSGDGGALKRRRPLFPAIGRILRSLKLFLRSNLQFFS